MGREEDIEEAKWTVLELEGILNRQSEEQHDLAIDQAHEINPDPRKLTVNPVKIVGKLLKGLKHKGEEKELEERHALEIKQFEEK